MSLLYAYDWFTKRMYAVDTGSARIVQVSDPLPDVSGFNGRWPRPSPVDGRFYVPVADGFSYGTAGEWWWSIDGSLSPSWSRGPVIGVVTVGGLPNFIGTAVLPTSGGLLATCTDSHVSGGAHIALLRFPDPTSPSFEVVAGPYPFDDDDENGPEAAITDGRFLYYTMEGDKVFAIEIATGNVEIALNLADIPRPDFDLSAPAVNTDGRIYAFGFQGNLSMAVFSGRFGAVGPPPNADISIDASWHSIDSGAWGFQGGGVILDGWYYFSGGTETVSRLNVSTGEFDGLWFNARLDPWPLRFSVAFLSNIGPGVPAQRQYPRDDGLGISTRRSFPPNLSQQFGLRHSGVNTYQ